MGGGGELPEENCAQCTDKVGPPSLAATVRYWTVRQDGRHRGQAEGLQEEGQPGPPVLWEAPARGRPAGFRPERR